MTTVYFVYSHDKLIAILRHKGDADFLIPALENSSVVEVPDVKDEYLVSLFKEVKK
jgi:hypothetical protein